MIIKYTRLFFTILILTGCQTSSNYDIVGEWRAVIQNTTTKQYTNAKEYIEFREDGKAHWRIEFWEPSIGNWRIIGDSIFLSTDEIEMKGTLIKKSADKLTLEVITLNEDELQLRIDLERRK